MTLHSYWQSGLDVNAADMRLVSEMMMPGPAGVRFAAGAPLAVSAQPTPNMTVRVNPGWAKSTGGYLGYNDTLATVTIPAASASPRRDLVVMKWLTAAPWCQLTVVQGAPGSNPALPSLAGMVAVPLGDIYVPAGASSIPAGSVTDARPLVVPTGSVAQVANETERNRLVKYDGLTVYRIDTQTIETHDGFEWRVTSQPAAAAPRVNLRTDTAGSSWELPNAGAGEVKTTPVMASHTFNLAAASSVDIFAETHVRPGGNAGGRLWVEVDGVRAFGRNWHSRSSTSHQWPSVLSNVALAAGQHTVKMYGDTTGGSAGTIYDNAVLSIIERTT